MPLGANKAAIMGVAGVSTADVVLLSSQTADGDSAISFTSGITSTYGEYIFGFYNINPGMNSRMIENARKIKEVHEAKKTNLRYGWYRLESGGDRSTWLFASAVYKWADLGNTDFISMYEEVHGKGSWAKWMNEYSQIVQAVPWARRAEFWRYVKEASSPPR